MPFVRWFFAALHLLALGIGLGAVWARGRALRGPLDRDGIRRVLAADTWWGVAAALWISTGLIRAFSSLEKGSAYYLHNYLFWIKMALLVAILAHEIRPMKTLAGWRAGLAQGGEPDTRNAARLARVSRVQAVLLVLMVIAATGMARGFGAF